MHSAIRVASVLIAATVAAVMMPRLADAGSAYIYKDTKNVTETSIQPLITKHFGKGWYVASQDIPWTYNHKSENWTTPIGPRLGRVMIIGEMPVNLFRAVYYDPNDDGASAKWTAKINVTLLFPK